MNDFKRGLAYCAAAITFAVGVVPASFGVISYLDQRILAQVAAVAAPAPTVITADDNKSQ